MAMIFLYIYQSPIMSIVEAISSVERYLQKPPEEWEVTIKYNGIEPTIVMDAYTGSFIDIYGPLN